MTDKARSAPPNSMVLVTRLAKQVYRRSNEDLLGMHLRLLMALSYVRDHDKAPQQELADALCMDANNVVLLLNELEDLSYVARRRDPDDRRRHLVELTAEGFRALTDAESAQETIEDDVLRALDPDERAILWRLLTRALQGAEPQTRCAESAAREGLSGELAAKTVSSPA
jgi:DNA-binding MarR family transcriptional regulator